MPEILEKLERNVLPLVNRPARYIGSEFGLKPPGGSAQGVKIALVYPDAYEVGMSNLGLRVLEAALSGLAGVSVERAFTPWPDAEELMRRHGVSLYGLGSFTPLRDFDLVGVTLQSELTFTNVLTVLDLAGIPLRREDRVEHDPLVCAGGPAAVNPETMAPFFDFFVLGDGEEAVCEVAAALLELKKRGVPRLERLERIGRIEGVYLPDGGPPPDGKISVRRVSDFDSRPSPDGLPVPLTELAQHHLSVEIMRGCTCGCRFCQAGMYYRPVRVRAVERIVEQVRAGVRAGGWNSVTLLSLSSADYPAIGELVERLLPELSAAGVTLAFPSLRVDRQTLALLERLEGGRRGGLTFAVEAGSSRLRDVIGKKVDEEELVSLVAQAFGSGWTLVKLYFMIGLPGETDQDVDDAARLINRLAGVASRTPGRRNINVTLSPFVPKPGTPFQWEAQAHPDVIGTKIGRIRTRVHSRRVTLKVHDPWMSALEGALARGSREVAGAVERAWRLGARFDGWGERFDPSIWKNAFAECGLDWMELLAERDEQAPLPWSFVRLPVEERFLISQRKEARREENVYDCADGRCLGCGVAKPEACRLLRSTPATEGAGQTIGRPLAAGKLPVASEAAAANTWRVRYAKRGLLRFVGHLDMVRNIEFMLRRSELPVLYSEGFNPRMRLHFSPPLPVGIESEAEYFDFETLPVSAGKASEALAAAARGLEGFQIGAVKELPLAGGLPQLAAGITVCRYRALVPADLSGSGGSDPVAFCRACIGRRLAEGGIFERTDKKGRERKIDLARRLGEIMVSAAGSQAELEFELEVQGDRSARADDFLRWLLGIDSREAALCRICKTEAYIDRDGRRTLPLEF
ncbi:MAG: TIGR03936 family radical SAM-associated protein [Candidatus Glassbacteria bacterium]